MSKFNTRLKQADSEKIVESLYHQELERALKASDVEVMDIKTTLKTDGIIDTNFKFNGRTIAMKIIVEVKKDETFQVAAVRSKALAQVVYYLKKFEMNGYELPHIVFIGDKSECFTLHTNYIVDYLKNDYDWKKAASQAYVHNPGLVLELTENEKLQAECFVYTVTDDFKLEEVVEKMKGLTVNTPVKVRVSEKNISKIFEYFALNVLARRSNGQSKYTPREQVEHFMQLVNAKEDCYNHPNKPGKAIFNGIEVEVKRDAFNQFKNHYDFNYTVEEKKEFTSIADRLIEDSDRRRKGDFYTPQIWVDESIKMLTENLGETWKEDYMVWDCAAGTNNLTRDYKFKELYTSTLEEHDLKISDKYNVGATKFQYDFLNDDVEIMDKLIKKVEKGHVLTEKDFYSTKLWQKSPELIKGLLGGKKLLFFINPPYGTANNQKTKITGEDMKKGMALTLVNEKMKEEKIGASSQNLYAQFIYRIIKTKELFGSNISMGIFCKGSILTAQTYSNLRNRLKNQFEYKNGMMFQASQFADCSDAWAIYFTVWKQLEDAKSDDGKFFEVEVKNLEDTGIASTGIKHAYSVDKDNRCSEWCKSEDKSKGLDGVQMTSALKYVEGPKNNKCLGNLQEGALGYYFNISNTVEKNSMEVFLVSSCTKSAHGMSIMRDNFERVCSNFTARRLITGKYADWVNDKDEYVVPNTENRLYDQWEKDSIIYSIFNNASNQSSLRGIDYNNKEWNVYNQFFFMGKDEMLELATSQETINNEVEQDIYDNGEHERYVYEKINEIEGNQGFSDDAQAVLDKARELVRSSFKYRKLFDMEKPEYHINTWDAGFYQLKGLLKDYDKEGIKEFTELYKKLEDRMRPLVYELGFLYL